MNKSNAFFDDFTMIARVMPALTVAFPILLIALLNGLLAAKWLEAGVGVSLATIVVFYLSYIAREWGKSSEEKIYKKLGAMPTTIIMRFSDDKVDEVSKTQCHKWFNDKGEQYLLPMSKKEERADKQSDNKYTNAMKGLRVYANSHRDKFPRVYQELKKYNYWRNLYGCKKFAIVSYLILGIREVLVIDNFGLKDMVLCPFPKYAVLIGLTLWIVLYCLTVTRKTVERNAFDYAITLMETTYTMDFELS